MRFINAGFTCKVFAHPQLAAVKGAHTEYLGTYKLAKACSMSTSAFIFRLSWSSIEPTLLRLPPDCISSPVSLTLFAMCTAPCNHCNSKYCSLTVHHRQGDTLHVNAMPSLHIHILYLEYTDIRFAASCLMPGTCLKTMNAGKCSFLYCVQLWRVLGSVLDSNHARLVWLPFPLCNTDSLQLSDSDDDDHCLYLIYSKFDTNSSYTGFPLPPW